MITTNQVKNYLTNDVPLLKTYDEKFDLRAAIKGKFSRIEIKDTCSINAKSPEWQEFLADNMDVTVALANNSKDTSYYIGFALLQHPEGEEKILDLAAGIETTGRLEMLKTAVYKCKGSSEETENLIENIEISAQKVGKVPVPQMLAIQEGSVNKGAVGRGGEAAISGDAANTR